MLKTALLSTILAVALFALPTSASQPGDVSVISLQPDLRLTAMQAVIGFDINPHPAQQMTITLPRGYTDLGIDADPFVLPAING